MRGIHSFLHNTLSTTEAGIEEKRAMMTFFVSRYRKVL
jgi:hypothetical protein